MGMNLGTIITSEQEFRKELIDRIAYWENRNEMVAPEEKQRFSGYYKKILFEMLEEDSRPKKLGQ
jgi:hypothetical protein